jgi:two-component system sensor histidine kinase/response regulator
MNNFQRSETVLRMAIRAAKIGLWDWDLSTNRVVYSTEWKHQLGYEDHEISGEFSEWESRVHPEDLLRVTKGLRTYLAVPSDGYEVEFRIRHRDGSWRWILAQASVMADEHGRARHMVGSHVDITEQKRMETELRHVNRALRLVSNCNKSLTRVSDEAAWLNEVCRTAVEVGGYRMAWVGHAEQDEGKSVRPLAQAGFNPGYIESAEVTWADDRHGGGPGGRAIRTGRPSIARNITADPTFSPWRAAAVRAGYKSSISLPLQESGRTFGILSIYAAEPDAFDTREVQILSELAADLAFGRTFLRTRDERDRAMQALEESRRKLEEAQRIAHVGHWERDLETEQIAWSDELYRICGLRAQERPLRRADLLEMIHPEDRQKWARSCYEAISGTGEYDVDYRLVRPDGTIRVVRSHGAVTRDRTGRARRMFGIAQDVTEQREARAALERALDEIKTSEDRLRVIIDTIPAMISSNLPDGSVDFANRRWMEFVGRPMEERQGWGWERGIHPDDLPGVIERWRAATATGESVEIESRIRRADGEYRWFLHRSVPLRDEEGTVIRWYSASTDIEDRRRAEQTLLALTENSPDLIARFDRNGRYQYVNAAIEKITTVPAREYLGKRLGDVTETQRPRARVHDLVDLRRAIDHVFVSGEGAEREINISAPDTERIFNVRLVPERDDAGRVASVLHIGRDVTDQRRAERELQRAERLASVGNFAAGIAHEINNPVGSILLSARTALAVLRDGKPTTMAEEFLESIASDAKRCGAIVKNVLRLARQETSERSPSDLNGVVTSARDHVHWYADQSGVAMRTELDPSPLPVMANALEVEQAIANLLRNAIEASERGGAVVLRTEMSDTAGTVTIADSGRGMDQAQLDRAFDPFVSSRGDKGGTGLGLTLTLAIISGHGGKLDIASVPGRGTTAIVTVPLLPEAPGSAGRSTP